LSAVLEEECNRTVRAQIAAVFGEGMTHIGYRANALSVMQSTMTAAPPMPYPS
jgi:hypothetical protein